MEINNDQLIGLLRNALHFLYDPSQLRRNPLIDLFRIGGEPNPSAALQKILIDSIEKIRPGQNEPPQARGWLLHDVLFLRYVRGYERDAVMNQLALSDRQLSREQKTAIENLALIVAHDYDLQLNLIDPADQSVVSAQPEIRTGAGSASALAGEGIPFSWVENLPTEMFASWKSILQSVVEILLPVIQKSEAHFEVFPVEGLPDFRVPQSILRHSLMIVMGEMIPFAQGCRFSLESAIMNQELVITATIYDPGLARLDFEGRELQPSSFEVASSLLERVKGKLDFNASAQAIETVITVPAIEEIPILVIDDNSDTIQLYQRYSQGSRYSITSTTSAFKINELLEQIHPRIILLDLMMPGVDGWDILSQLRQAPPHPPVAVVVCSILPMEKVAHSLGADGFLRKPVLPQDFLRTLDDQIDILQKNDSPG